MKKILCTALTASVVLLGAAEKDYSSYSRIMTDSGIGTDHSFLSISNPGALGVKKLELSVDPTAVKQAAVEIESAANGYDPQLKTYIKNPKHAWHDMIFTINGKVFFKGNPGKMMQKGLHQIDIDPALLKKGENIITLTWAPRKKDAPGVIGYFYMAVDNNAAEKARRKIPQAKRPASANDSIRIRLLIKL